MVDFFRLQNSLNFQKCIRRSPFFFFFPLCQIPEHYFKEIKDKPQLNVFIKDKQRETFLSWQWSVLRSQHRIES